MSADGLDALRRRVHGDSELALRLRGVAPELFVADALRLASENGDDVTAEDIAVAMSSAKRAWALRWVR